MTDISSIGHGSMGPVKRATIPLSPLDADASRAERIADSRGDRVELSDHARFLDRLRTMPDVRNEKIMAIREAIADGTYETEEKLRIAVSRLLNDLAS